jgi:ribosomal-protein-alanine N-acetyltransferase
VGHEPAKRAIRHIIKSAHEPIGKIRLFSHKEAQMLIGKTIALKPATPDDAQLVADWFSDPAYLGEFFNISPHTRQMMESDLADAHGPEKGLYLITNRERQEPMGMVGFWNPFTLTAFFKGLELWWNLHPQHRHRGVATQAVCLLINHLFDSTPTERLQACIVPGNEPSCRVAERAGMQRDGIYRKVFFLHGRYVDLHLYSIVREDWKDEQTYRQGRAEF